MCRLRSLNRLPILEPRLTVATIRASVFLQALRRRLETAKIQNSESADIHEPTLFSVSIAPTSAAKLVRLLDAFVKAAESKGYTIEPGPDALQLHVKGEAISISASEKRDRVPHQPTEKELAALKKWEKEFEIRRKRNGYASDYDRPKIPEWDRPFNGLLMIEIDKQFYHQDGLRRKFSDGKRKNQPLQNMLSDILSAADAIAERRIADRLESERRAAKWKEEARLAEVARRRQHLEEKRIEALEAVLKRWGKAEEVRAFVAAVEARMPGCESVNEQAQEWIGWVRTFADRIDPLMSSLPLLAHEQDIPSWPSYERG